MRRRPGKRARVEIGPFFFNDTATTEIYTLSLHDALPICPAQHPHPLLHQISPWAGRSGEDESTAEERSELQKSYNLAQHAVADGEEAAEGRKCDGGRASGPGSKSVHRKRSLGRISRDQVR